MDCETCAFCQLDAESDLAALRSRLAKAEAVCEAASDIPMCTTEFRADCPIHQCSQYDFCAALADWEKVRDA